MEFVEIRWNSGSLDEARKVSRYLVQDRLAACAEIIPWVESITMLNNQLQTSQESTVVLRTRSELLDKVLKIIEQNSHFQIPEIIVTPILQANPVYTKWLEESTSIAIKND